MAKQLEGGSERADAVKEYEALRKLAMNSAARGQTRALATAQMTAAALWEIARVLWRIEMAQVPPFNKNQAVELRKMANAAAAENKKRREKEEGDG